MNVDTGSRPGFVVVTEATEVLGLTLETTLTPHQAEVLANGPALAKHPREAAKLRQAAHTAWKVANP